MHLILAQAETTMDAATTFVNALTASGLPIAMVVFGLALLIFLGLALRWVAGAEKRDSNRSQMDAQNLANALNNRDSETAKAIKEFTQAIVANSASIESSAMKGDAHRVELTAATQQQTAELSGLRADMSAQEARRDISGAGLIGDIDSVKEMITRLLKANENNPTMQTAIMDVLELHTKLLKQLISLLTPQAASPAVAAIVAIDTALKDAEVNITPGQVGITELGKTA